MSYSVSEIKCDKCANCFTGVLTGLFNVGAIYTAKCPKCHATITLNPRAAFVDTIAPAGAVAIIQS